MQAFVFDADLGKFFLPQEVDRDVSQNDKVGSNVWGLVVQTAVRFGRRIRMVLPGPRPARSPATAVPIIAGHEKVDTRPDGIPRMMMKQPDQLLARLAKEWSPPLHRPLNGEPSGDAFDEKFLTTVVNNSFFASLRTEEGTAQSHGIVLVHGADDLVDMYPPWSLHRLEEPLPLDAERIAKVATLAADDDAFIVVAEADPPVIIGFGQAKRSSAPFAVDRYPRIRAVGPGDLVFSRGDSAVFRYRAGCVEELQPDFFIGGDEPRAALMGISRQLFAHWPDAHMASTKDIVGPVISRCIRAISTCGHGGDARDPCTRRKNPASPCPRRRIPDGDHQAW